MHSKKWNYNQNTLDSIKLVSSYLKYILEHWTGKLLFIDAYDNWFIEKKGDQKEQKGKGGKREISVF